MAERSLKQQIQFSDSYYHWRVNVMTRDNFTCQDCNKKGRQKTVLMFLDLPVLYVSHIKPFDDILKENNITNEAQAMACTQLWDVSNGVTRCVSCFNKKRFPYKLYRYKKVWKLKDRVKEKIIGEFDRRTKAKKFKKKLIDG